MVSRFAWALVVCVAATTVFAPTKAEEGAAASKCKEEKEVEATGTELHQETAGGMKRGSQGYDSSKLNYLGRRGYSDRYYLAYHGRDYYFPNRRLNQEHDHDDHDEEHEEHDHEEHDHDHEDEEHDHEDEEHDHEDEEHDHDHEDEGPTPEPEPEHAD